MPCKLPSNQAGFTLIEMIMVIVLIAALVGVSAVFIVQPFQASEDLERRAELVDAADLALARIVGDVRFALPNSVREHSSGDVHMIEFVSVVAGGRYRRLPGDGETDIFVPAPPSGTFNVIGDLQGVDDIEVEPGVCGDQGVGDCLSIYNMPSNSQRDYSVYYGKNSARVTDATENLISYNEASFETHSPSQRFYIFDTVNAYVCNLETGELRRYKDYGLNEEPEFPTGNNGEDILIVDNVSECDFDYRDGTATRRGLLTMRLELERDGERVELLVQAGVMNTP